MGGAAFRSSGLATPADSLLQDFVLAEITVAIVSWNTRELLKRCLESFYPLARTGIVDVWVVDNGSHDGSRELVRRDFPWVELVEPEQNLGFGRAVNLVAQRAHTPWIASANADIEVNAASVAHLLRLGAQLPTAAVLSPAQLGADGRVQKSVWPFPTVRSTAARALGLHRLFPSIAGSFLDEGRWDASQARWVDYAMGAFLLIRRDAFETVGGFDVCQWMYAEDLDLCWRLARIGLGTWYEPGATIIHIGGASSDQAFGKTGTATRTAAAHYHWIALRQGRGRFWIHGTSRLIGDLVRLAALSPMARLLGGRWGVRRQRAREWAKIYSAGFGLARGMLRASDRSDFRP